ncbi:MAG: hypothetical protein C5B43_00035 [Verrucomicrobia bacterium]|nr:MAG: hypothetical protein C5B43_00035 [Verrucomicrobiota bacterium]
MRNVKLLIALLSVIGGCLTWSYAEDLYGLSMEDASMKSNNSYTYSRGTDRLNEMDEADYDAMEMSAGETGGSSYNIDVPPSLQTGYGSGISSNPGGQRGRELEEN